MHIAQIFDAEIPPTGYGGIERVVYWLVREFHRQGHKVTLIARAPSNVVDECPGVNFLPYHDIEKLPREMLEAFDIAHFHNTVEASWADRYPHLVTEHGNDKRKLVFDRNSVFLSRSHAQNHRATHFLPNGIPLQDYPFSPAKNNKLLFLARLNWRAKNARTAINLAFDTSTSICLTGGELKASRKTWGSWVLRYPFKKSLIEEYGVVDGVQKLQLLKDSMCLYYLVNWHEPFALAPHEALACGTPVLATPNGALAEYIQDGVNGFIVRDYAQAKNAIDRLKSMSPDEREKMAGHCRASAYTIEESVRQHIVMYERILRDGYLYSEEQARAIGFTNPPAVKLKK